jgi:UDP-N-acetylglucosamine diphosphorylase / glucose-1-phosphate thymidylyltransferase / UDP-N-acetylgalactosamine diphosphorylase / glucosamine-1-phosphate N-acetyltransferase / galactosamine-1-phosphate N-acetyltransferase
MRIVLFEDEHWRSFAALAQVRPLYEFRCGALTLRERVHSLLALRGMTPNIQGLCRPHLMACFGTEGGIWSMLSSSMPLLFVNARLIDVDWLPELLNEPLNTAYVAEDTLVAAYLSPALASAVLYYLQAQQSHDALQELRRFAAIVDLEARHALTLLKYPWDLIGQAGNQIVRDAALLAGRLLPYRGEHAGVQLYNPAQIRVDPTAQLDGPLVLDARDGPILIDHEAHIEPFSYIQGPVYIGPRTLIASARIRGETSFGPVCRIGGEVEASTVQGYSNKHHDGFLGHSWLGEWVNIGAMTTNSDLKNNYGSVRMSLEGIGQIDSGVLKLGCFLGDHVKLGIGLHLNGGTIIGVGSNIFGVHFAPKTVPSFIWGGEVFHEYRIENMIGVARTVMGRRKCELSPAYETLLRTAFAMTYHSRSDLVHTQQALPPVNVAELERVLARAEYDVMHAA